MKGIDSNLSRVLDSMHGVAQEAFFLIIFTTVSLRALPQGDVYDEFMHMYYK